MKRRLILPLAALMAAIMLLGAACGGDDNGGLEDDETSTSTPRTTRTATPDGDETATEEPTGTEEPTETETEEPTATGTEEPTETSTAGPIETETEEPAETPDSDVTEAVIDVYRQYIDAVNARDVDRIVELTSRQCIENFPSEDEYRQTLQLGLDLLGESQIEVDDIEVSGSGDELTVRTTGRLVGGSFDGQPVDSSDIVVLEGSEWLVSTAECRAGL